VKTTKPQVPEPIQGAKQYATGGRGARERILNAAGQLFYERGIHATGVAALVEAAHVSTRTFYQQFESKNALVEEYLRQFETDGRLTSEAQLSREDLGPAERLLAIFDPMEAMLASPTAVRGCPFHNAAVEAAGAMPEVARFVERHKQAFADRIAVVAAEAGIVDASRFARQLSIVYEGASAMAASRNDTQVIQDARAVAATLVESALERRD
jgi:AcrR family transcriptional regulator